MSSEVWLIAGARIGTALIAILGLRVMTHLLSPSEYGLLVLMMAFQSFAGLVLINPAGQWINRQTHQWWDEGTLLARLRRANLLWAGASILTGLLAMGWVGAQAKEAGSPIAVFLAVAGVIFATTVNGIALARLNAIGRRHPAAIWQITSGVLALACSAGFAWYFHGPIAWLLGQAVGLLAGAVAGWSILADAARSHQKYSPHSASRNIFDREAMVKYWLPLALTTTLMWLEGTGYRFLIENAHGLAIVGLFGLGLAVPAQMTAVFESVVAQYLGPYVFRHLANANTARDMTVIVSDYASVVLPLFLIWTGVLLLACESVLALLVEPAFSSAAQFLFYGVVLELLRLVGAVWSVSAQARRSTRRLIIPYALAAAIVWGGGYWVFARSMPFVYFAYCLILAAVVRSMLIVHGMHRLLPITPEPRRIVYAIGLLAACYGTLHAFSLTFGGLTAFAWLAFLGIAFFGAALCFLWKSPPLMRLKSIRLD